MSDTTKAAAGWTWTVTYGTAKWKSGTAASLEDATRAATIAHDRAVLSGLNADELAYFVNAPVVNPWEQAGRARKIRAITETIDLFAPAIWNTKPTAAELYLALSRMERHWWNAIALHSNVNCPSAETIAEVLAVYRSRALSGPERAAVEMIAPSVRQ